MPLNTITDKKPSRGADTKDKLIAAGLSLFGRRGFDGVSARDVSAAAGTPLSAIPYHFVTMESLYLACIDTIVGGMNERLEPEISRIQAQFAADTRAPATRLNACIAAVTEALAREMILCDDDEEWIMLVMREHMQPGPGFERIYDNVMLRSHGLLSQLIAQRDGLDADSEAARLAAFAHMGKIVFFKLGQATLMRRMGWATVGEPEFAQIMRSLNP